MLQDSTGKPLRPQDKRLKNGDKLQAIQYRIEKEKRLVSMISETTGLDCKSIFVSNSEGDVLVLQTTNSSVATQLRLSANNILEKITQESITGKRYNSIKVQVRPLYQKQRSKQKTMRSISKENAALLEETAQHSDNPKLKAVLERLAQHRERQGK
jgi:hypothetical protein